MRNRRVVIAILSLAAVGLLVGYGPESAGQSASGAGKKHVINAISGTVGGVWFVGFGAISKVITEDFPGSTVNLVAGGSTGNPIRINRGEGNLSITQHSNAVAGTVGREPYKEKLTNVRSILNINDITRLNIVVRADLPIKSIQDIKDKRMSLRFAPGPLGTVSESFGRWTFNEYGISFADLQAWGGRLSYGSYNEVAVQMRDGRLDGFFWTGPGQAAFIQDVTSAVKLRWLPVDAKVLKTLGEKYGLGGGFVPADYYGGAVGTNVPTPIDSTELIVPASMPDDVAYDLVKTILNHRSDIAIAYSAWKSIDPKTAPHNLGFPMHPGARKYYVENGLLK